MIISGRDLGKIKKSKPSIKYLPWKSTLPCSPKLEIDTNSRIYGIHACFYFSVDPDCGGPFDLYHAYACPEKMLMKKVHERVRKTKFMSSIPNHPTSPTLKSQMVQLLWSTLICLYSIGLTILKIQCTSQDQRSLDLANILGHGEDGKQEQLPLYP